MFLEKTTIVVWVKKMFGEENELLSSIKDGRVA